MRPHGPSFALFDLDNTLIPFLPAMRAWADAWAQRLVSPTERRPFAEDLLQCSLEQGEDPARGLSRAVARWGLTVGVDRFEQLHHAAHTAYRQGLAPYEGVGEVLEHLARRGVELAVVTDAPADRALHRLRATSLDHHFDVVVTRDDTPHGKEGPEPFEQALDALGAAPEQTTMVGDWPQYDVRWPKRLGLRTVLAEWGCQREHRPANKEEVPWAVAREPGELPPLLLGTVAPPEPLASTTQAPLAVLS